MANNLFDSPFGECAWGPADAHQNGLTTPLPGIGTPALNTPPTQNESVGTAWRGDGFVQATDSARPAQLDSVFNGEPGLAGMDNNDSGSAGGGSGAIDSPFGTPLWTKP